MDSKSNDIENDIEKDVEKELEKDLEKTETPPAPWRVFLRRLHQWTLKKRFSIEIGLFIIVLVVLFFWNNIFISVHSGEMGVLYRRFWGGTVLDKPPLGEGLHIIFPWNKIYVYNMRAQQINQQFYVLTKEGLNITLDISIRYHPRRDKFALNYLHKELGPDYLHTVVIPEIQSALRFIIGKYEPQELYQTDFGMLDAALSEALLQLTESYVVLDDLLVMKVTLPQMVQQAIEEKLTEEHNAEKYKYLLKQAEEEAKRKVILAQGIRDFQDVVSEGISEQLLQWRGIEATLELARSPNAKIVIIGGRDGLPLIFNTGDSLSASSAANSASNAIKNTTGYFSSDPIFNSKTYEPIEPFASDANREQK
jgi:regulator of protease activity HflC (stomatin/prohibitin superfamily)